MRQSIHSLLFTIAVLAVAGALAFCSTRFTLQRDFSYGQRGSLNAQTVALLQQLDEPVQITSYVRRDSELRALISDFVSRYQRIKPNIALVFFDPDQDPGKAREQGVRIDGELEIKYKDKTEQLKIITEQELTNALLRLSRNRVRLVGFLSGDGERKPDGKANADLANFAALLQAQGARAIALNLAATQRIPENVDLLVLANPQVQLAQPLVDELVDYVERGGHLLWLTEPGEAVGLQPLAKAVGVRVLNGTAVDGASAQFGIGDPSFVAVAHYPAHAITKDFELVTMFPQAAAVAALADARWDVKPLLRTSDKSWTEIGAIPKGGNDTATIRYDADKGELPGPLDLGFALTRLSPRPGAREQRVVVLGDGDFLSNSFLGNGGNREFGQRIFNWLLADDDLIEVPNRGAPDRQLTIGQTALGALSFGFLLALPASLVLTGALIWWRRRRR